MADACKDLTARRWGFSLALGRGRWAVVSKYPNARGAPSRYHLTL